MGIDTLYWGPSGWQLFHLIAFRSPHPKKVLSELNKILPCRFCRESSTEFMKELPLKGDVGKWLYDLHNKVNNKLRTQCKDDPKVIDPGPDPSFEDIKEKYMNMKLTDVPGRDFLFSISANYPTEPTAEDIKTQKEFLENLKDTYPFLQKDFESYVNEHQPSLESKKTYMKWMYGLIQTLAKKVPVEIPSYKGYVQRVMYYTSGCDRKTYKGKTCRRLNGGGYTKNRDRKRTYKITRMALL